MSDWILSAIKPEPFVSVLIAHKTKRCTVVARAVWIPKFFKEDIGDYEGDCDYCEEADEYFWPEGWYEWSEEAEINYKLSGEVTHWMELPKLPNAN